MIYKPYREQVKELPESGCHILAQFDADSIYVYQAFCPQTAHFAVKNQHFGDGFSFNRMSWIKPNFLWMMYRSGWATKENQEIVLAIRIHRGFFDRLLGMAVPSLMDLHRYSNEQEWQTAVKTSDVRLQWDPDRHPAGNPMNRRAIQLGLRGDTLREYAMEATISIEDLTPFVTDQRNNRGDKCKNLLTPWERVYRPSDLQTASSAGIDPFPHGLEA